MKKKIVSVMLIAAMTVGLIAGCGNKETEKEVSLKAEASATDEESSIEEATADENKVAINIYRCTFNLTNPDQKQVKKVEDAINSYIADKSNIEIHITDIASGEYGDKAHMALLNNEINLVWTASWMATIGTDDLWRQNAVYDITDLVQGTTLYESMSEGIWEASKYDGKILFIPVYKESYEGYDLKVREEFVNQYGWDLSGVKSLKDIEPFLADLQADGVKYPFTTNKAATFYKFYLEDYDFFTQYSFLGVDRNTDTVVNPILEEDYLEFCTMMCEWAEKGYISEDDVAKSTPDSVGQSENWGFSWWTCVPGDEEANTESRDLQDEIIIEGLTPKYAHSTTTLGSCYAVTSNSTEEQAKACIDFLGLLYTDTTVADLFTYGVKGEDYTLNDEGKVVLQSEAYNHSAWESTSIVPLTLAEGDADDKVEQYNSKNAEAETSCAAGFRFDKTPIEAQWMACVNIFDQYGYVLENGGYASADVPAMIEEFQSALDDAGYQEILAEASNQYEAWKTTK